MNKGIINVNKGTTSGSAVYIYSGKAINEKSGVINLLGDEARGFRAYGGVIHGADVNEFRDIYVLNAGKILGDNNKLYGMNLTKIGTKDAILENAGQIILSGQANIGMYLWRKVGENGKALGINAEGGEISILGKDSIAMYGDNSEITNNGIIKLNIFQEDGKTLSNNKAMYGENESVVKNTGSLYLTDVISEKVSEEDLTKLESYVNNYLISGDETSKIINVGVIRNKDGAIIIANGENIGGMIPDLEVNENGDYILTDEYISNLDKNQVLTTDKTLDFTGDSLNINVNANSDFDANKHLVSLVNNENTTVTGNLIGANKGILIDKTSMILKNSKIEVNVLNDKNIALDFKNESKGEVLSSTIIGNIAITDKSVIKLEDSKINGNILLDKSSSLALDKSTTENFTGIIKGNNNGSEVILGKNITKFNGTIENVDNVKTNGILIMEENSKLINSSIQVNDEHLLVIRIGAKEKTHALSTNVGVISLSNNGHMMIETGRANIKAGDILNLGTIVIGDSSNIHASQYIYDISLAEVTRLSGGSQLIVSLKNAIDLGLDLQVSDVYASLANAGKLGELVSVSIDKNKSELNKILKQNSEENSYVLGYKASKDSIESWSNTVTNNINFLKGGEFKVSGLGMGAIENTDTNMDYKFAGTGLMAIGEYGYNSNTTFGLALGGGSILGEKNSKNKVSGDSFYVSAFAKKIVEDILLTANIGYQFNRLDGKRNVENIYESYSFKNKFNTNGFNVDLEGKYIYTLENGYTLEPHIGLGLVAIKQDSINENIENGPLAMELDSIKNTTLKTKVGVELAKNIITDLGAKIKVFGDLSYVNNSGDVNKDIKGKFEGSTSEFNIRPLEIGRNKGEICLGGRIEGLTGIFVDTKLTYSFGDMDYTKVTMGLGYKF